MRKFRLALCVLLLAGCSWSSAPHSGSVATSSNRLLVELAGGGYATVDLAAQKVIQLGGGVPAPDGRLLYTAHRSGESTEIDALSTSTGDFVPRTALGRDYLPILPANGPGGISANGAFLVLAPASPTPGMAEYAVLDVRSATPPRFVSLRGRFEYDAISDDGNNLYLVEQLGGSAYHVRLVDVQTNRLDPRLITDKGAPQLGLAPMYGTRQASAAILDTVFSLYVGMTHPFIHVLSTSATFAHCIDLPPISTPVQGGWSLALSPGGASLYAVNPAVGLIAKINVDKLSIERTMSFRLPDSGPAAGSQTAALAKGELGAAAVSPDSRTLYVPLGHGYAEFDAATLVPRRVLLPEAYVRSLVPTPDGRSLFATLLGGGGLVRIDTGSGRVAQRYPWVADPDRILRVLSA